MFWRGYFWKWLLLWSASKLCQTTDEVTVPKAPAPNRPPTATQVTIVCVYVTDFPGKCIYCPKYQQFDISPVGDYQGKSCKCPKYSTTKHSLKVHQLTHTGEKAFACDQCEKSFTFKWNLQVHQQRHLEAKPVLCKSCNKTFKTTADLYHHKWIWKHGVRISKCQ